MLYPEREAKKILTFRHFNRISLIGLTLFSPYFAAACLATVLIFSMRIIVNLLGLNCLFPYIMNSVRGVGARQSFDESGLKPVLLTSSAQHKELKKKLFSYTYLLFTIYNLLFLLLFARGSYKVAQVLIHRLENPRDRLPIYRKTRKIGVQKSSWVLR